MPIYIGGWLESRQTYTYDADGRLTQQLNETRKTDWTKKDQSYEGADDIHLDSGMSNSFTMATRALTAQRPTSPLKQEFRRRPS